MTIGKPFTPGVSGNPGGRTSIPKDFERAHATAVPLEVQAVLQEWRDDAEEQLRELGPAGFLDALKQQLDDAAARVLPLTPADARAQWWRMILPVALAGPKGPKDSNWQYAAEQVGSRLMGKPKETVVIEGAEAPPIDWKRVPVEERQGLLDAMTRLAAYASAPDSSTEH